MKPYLYLILLTSCLIFLIYPAISQEPIKLSTKTEDIALTDDINIARAQVTKYPENPEAHFNLAIALSRTSLIEEAIKELRKTKLLLRKSENIGVIDKKIYEFTEILKNDPAANNIRYRLAFSHYLKAYLLSKNLEKSKNLKNTKNKKKSPGIDLFSSSKLLTHTTNPDIKRNLELSISYFNDLLKTAPNDPWAKIYYGFILVEQNNNVNKARELWKEVLNQDANNPAPYFFLGELHIKEGNLKEGILEISQALLLRAQGY